MDEKYQGLYDELAKLEEEDTVTLTAAEGKAPKAEKAKGKPAKDEKPAAKGKDSKAKDEKPAAKSKADKEPKAEKPAKAKKEEVARDRFGSAEGTVRAKVNKALGKGWKTDEAIATEAGVKLKQARHRLRRAAREGILEVQRMIQYRIKPEKE